MAASAYKVKGNSDHNTAVLITAGFSGQLKGWWDNYINPEERTSILNKKKIIVKTENNVQIQTEEDDMVNTLIFTIMKHFIGDPSHFQTRSSETLINHTCPTLTDFRQYKDVFLTKVFTRTDSDNTFWKERFIAGLPKLFAHRVRNRIRVEFNNSIPYPNITYGQLINYINLEGLSLCNDLKLKAKLKNEFNQSRKELGDFCSQYGYEKLEPPSLKKRKNLSTKFKRKRNTSYQSPIKHIPKRTKQERKDKTNKSLKRRLPVCFKCKRVGHYQRDCKMKDKIKNLNIDSDIKENLLSLMLSDSESNQSSDIEINAISDSDLCDQEIKCHNGLCHCNLINMITKEKEILIEAIEKISDPEIRKEYLLKLKD